MSADPKGYYARLDVSPAATAEEIHAAFRRKARIVHPDVPGTGDAAAFVALRAAYDVLADPLRRAEYDRLGHPPPPPSWTATPRPRPAPVARKRGGYAGFVISLTLLGVAGVVAVVMLLQLATPTFPPAPPPSPSAAPQPAPQLVRIQLVGIATHYVAPGPGPATLWLRDEASHRLVPAARLAPFTTVHAVAYVPDQGLIAVSLEGGGVGFIDAARMTPGDAAAARRAYCADQAGPIPGNAELLARRGPGGQAKLIIHNEGEEPAVVKLRDLDGHAEAMVYVAPAIRVTVINLPGGPWRADVAVGDLWSRACAMFAAGMRAERLSGTVEPGSELTLPVDPAGGAEDIPDEAFLHN